MLKELYKKAMDIVYVNFIWIAVSFLGILITLGASTTAMFRVIFQVFKTKEPTNVASLFFKSFKENFLISTLVYLGLLILGLSSYIMLRYAIINQMEILIVIGIVVSYEIIIFTIYFFAVLAVFETTDVKALLKNVMLLSNYHLWTNFKILGSFVFVLLLILYIHQAFIVVAVGLYGFLVAFHLLPVFKTYIQHIEGEGSN